MLLECRICQIKYMILIMQWNYSIHSLMCWRKFDRIKYFLLLPAYKRIISYINRFEVFGAGMNIHNGHLGETALPVLDFHPLKTHPLSLQNFRPETISHNSSGRRRICAHSAPVCGDSSYSSGVCGSNDSCLF